MKKRFGQNLLIDSNYVKKITNSIRLNEDDVVLEIGAGTGNLTFELAEKCKKVYAVEFERDIIKTLSENVEKSKADNIEIIQSDILALDFNSLISERFIVVGNIPYNITSKILLKIFGEIDNPSPHLEKLKHVYLMMQLEVARRLVAKPGSKEYSPLTLAMQFYSRPRFLFEIPAQAFYPVPKVTSAYVDFVFDQEEKDVKDRSLLKNIIRTCFQQRRKKIKHPLEQVFESKEEIKSLLQRANISEDLRPDKLSLEDYVCLTNSV